MLAFQTASRSWLTLAGLSLFLPADVRLGIWLPLHLAVAGAASSAIFGAAQLFSTTMTNTLDPPTRVVWTEFGLVNVGVAAIAIGRVAAWGWLVAAGGTAFVGAACLLAWVIRRAWTKGINKRHPLPIYLYGFAVGCVIVGGLLGESHCELLPVRQRSVELVVLVEEHHGPDVSTLELRAELRQVEPLEVVR